MEYLKELGFTEVDDWGRIQPDKDHIGGRWYYAAGPEELHFLPTIAKIAMSVRGATNVQKCDRKFLMSYLLKYSAACMHVA